MPAFKKEKIDWQCPICKKWFKFHKSECKNRKSCSYKCGGVAISKRMKEAWNNPNSTYNSDRYKENHKEYYNDEVREKIRKAMKVLWDDPNSVYNSLEYIKAHKKRQKIVNNCPERIAKFKKTMALPGVKKRHRESIMRAWQNPKFKKEMLEKIFKGRDLKPNNLEQFYNRLTPDVIRYVGDGQFFIATKKQTYNPDFKISGQRKIIEIFGDFWHKGENPKDKIKEYAKVGWECIVFWESEVYNKTEQVLKKTLEFIEDKKVSQSV